MAVEELTCVFSASPFHFVDGAYLRDGNSIGLVGCFTPDLIFRNHMTWDASEIAPSALVVTGVEIDINMNADESGNQDTKTYKINAYNTNGLGTPETDTDEDAYNRCAGTNYVSGITQFRAPGLYTIDITAGAAAHVQAAIDGGLLFSIGIQETTENPATEHIVKPEGDTGAPTPAVLRITLTEAEEPPPEESGSSPGSSDGQRWAWR